MTVGRFLNDVPTSNAGLFLNRREAPITHRLLNVFQVPNLHLTYPLNGSAHSFVMNGFA